MTATEPYSELSDAEVLRLLLMHGTSGRAERLAQDGMIGFHWAGRAELESVARPTRDKVRAAQYLVCRLAGQRVAAQPLTDPAALACFLFLELAKPDRRAQGVLMLGEAGDGLGSRLLEPSLGLARPCDHSTFGALLSAATRYGARYLVPFFLRPGGEPLLKPCEGALASRLRALAEPLCIESYGSLVVTAPAVWRSHPLLPVIEETTLKKSSFVGLKPATFRDVRRCLSVLLGRVELAPQEGPAAELTEGLQTLAHLPPDRFQRDDMTPHANQAIAALLELGRRLYAAEVSPELLPEAET